MPEPSGPVVVLSDLHLGHGATRLTDPAMLTPVLDGSARVLFNGDTFEQLSLRYRTGALDRLGGLLDLCRRLGTHPTLVTGNHDPYASSCDHLDLCDGRVFVTHGDALHPGVAPWSHDARSLRIERDRLLADEPQPQGLEEELHLIKRTASIASRYERLGRDGGSARRGMVMKFLTQPQRALKAFWFWSQTLKYAQALRNRHRPQASLMLFGHTHKANVWQTPQAVYVNTGSYQPMSQPLAVRLHGDRYDVCELKLKASQYRPGDVLHDGTLGA